MAKKKKQFSEAAAPETVKAETDAKSTQLLVSTLTSLEAAVRRANALPEASSLEFACTTYPDISKAARTTSRQVLAALRSVGSRYDTTLNATDSESDDADSAASLTAYEELYEQVGQVSEEILEQFNVALDAARGIKDAVIPATGGIEPGFRIEGGGELEKPKGGVGWVEMEKPQLKFPDFPVDNSDTPFVPPYGEAGDGEGNVGSYLQDLYKANSNSGGVGSVGGKHPYEREICAVAEEMGRRAFDKKDTMLFGDLDSTPCTFVDTEDVLFEMAEQLKKAREIAVDIENHSMRSFQGFTCLIQISTRRADFVVDALALRGSIHRALAPVFSDESTVKVMHGADKDVEWLERDFGIYVVNMFDTGQAARALTYPSFSLSHLLARFCSVVSPNKKKFQLADWRQRPLPQDMFEYARSDTHYLLYICDRLRVELGKKDKLATVWDQSAVVARKRHKKVRYDERMPRRLAAKHGLGFDRHQIRLFEELHRWRDRKAREEDESLHYVAPLKSLLGIVRARDHGRTVKGMLEKGFPSSKFVPPLIREHADEVVTLITHTLDAALIDVEEVTNEAGGKEEKKAEKRTATNGNGESTGAGDVCSEGGTKQKGTGAEMVGNADGDKNAVKSKRKEVLEPPKVKASVLRKCALMDGDSSESEAEETNKDGGERRKESSGVFRTDEDKQKEKGKSSGGSNEEVAVGIGEEKTDRVVKVKMASRSVFDFSSDEGEGEDEKDEGVVREERENGGVGEDGNVSGKGVGGRGRDGERSMFDMSSDEEEGEVERRREIIARVHAGMTKLAPMGPSEFRLETDGVEEEERGKERVEVGVKRVREEEKREGDGEGEGEEGVKSLLEMYGMRKNGRKKKKRKKKVREEEGLKGSERLEAFDYGKMEEKDQGGQSGRDGKSFDPLEKLRHDWKEKKGKKGRVRKAKKRPGSGVRSLSFKAG